MKTLGGGRWWTGKRLAGFRLNHGNSSHGTPDVTVEFSELNPPIITPRFPAPPRAPVSVFLSSGRSDARRVEGCSAVGLPPPVAAEFEECRCVWPPGTTGSNEDSGRLSKAPRPPRRTVDAHRTSRQFGISSDILLSPVRTKEMKASPNRESPPNSAAGLGRWVPSGERRETHGDIAAH